MISPLIHRFELKPAADETTARIELRKKDAIKKLGAATKNFDISVFAVVRDIRQADLKRTQVEDFLSDQQERSNRLELEKATFDFVVAPKKYPMLLPSVFRIRVGEVAISLKTGDCFCLVCKVGEHKNRIGEFEMKHPESGFRFAVSVLSFSIPEIEDGQRITANLADLVETPKPIVNSAKMTRESFKQNFDRLTGSQKVGPFIVAKGDLDQYLGKPSQRATFDRKTTWIFQCIDGRVLLEILEGVEAVVPSDCMMIISVNDF